MKVSLVFFPGGNHSQAKGSDFCLHRARSGAAMGHDVHTCTLVNACVVEGPRFPGHRINCGKAEAHHGWKLFGAL